jgi:hypothetical protein
MATIVHQKRYKQFIAELIDQIPEGIPIFSMEIVQKVMNEFSIEQSQARTVVNTNLNRLKNGEKIEGFRRGIYYKPKQTTFGKSHLNPAHVIMKMYVNPNDKIVVGYETGASLLHKLGLTTQMPKYQFIATNNTSHNRVADDLKVVLRKPRMEVAIENYLYLQVLDALENKDRIAIDIPYPDDLITKYIEDNKIDFGKLLATASKYPKRVYLRLEKVAENRMRKEIEEFDDAFPDGVFAIPSEPNEPKVKVRALRDYCKSKGITPQDLTGEEWEQFLVRKKISE